MNKIQDWIVFAGRIFLGLSFLGSGILTISGWEIMLKEVSSSYLKTFISSELMPTVLVAKILIEVVGGLCLCTGFRSRLAASVLAGFIALKLVLFHDPLAVSGKRFVYYYSAFLDDAKILGGLLIASITAPGKYSVEKK